MSDIIGGCYGMWIVPDPLNGATISFEVSWNGEHNVFAKHINADGALGGPKPVRVIPPTRAQIMGVSEGLVRYEMLEPSIVKIDLYNLLGQHVRTIKNIYLQPGNYTLQIERTGLVSGVYFLKICTPGRQQVTKMVIVG